MTTYADAFQSIKRKEPILKVRNLSKRFPGVLAVSSVSIDIFQGEVMALIGQNGAGKSTFIQTLAGAHPYGTYTGEVIINGNELRARGVADAEAAGIVMIPQELNVVSSATVAEFILLNIEPARWGFIDWEHLYSDARQVLVDFELDVDPWEKMDSLDVATQQLIVIAKALHKRPRALILDEPTASLTESETERMFERIQFLKEKGVACIFVSHRLDEVFNIADRIVVIRDGVIKGDHRKKETNSEQVIAEMMGKKLIDVLIDHEQQVSDTGDDIALRVDGLTVYQDLRKKKTRVKNVSFEINKGEILGMFGLVGSGCTAVVKAIFGAWGGPWEGDVWIYGEKCKIRSPAEAIQLGIGLITEDRNETIALGRSVMDNIGVASLESYTNRLGFLNREDLRAIAKDYVSRLDIKTPSLDTLAQVLSGGNLQKLIIARWLVAKARILLLDDPTRGVDVGSRMETFRIMKDLTAAGNSILLISSDAKEILLVSDRVLTMRKGQIVGKFSVNELGEEQLLQLASGG
jgi:D-xylose transport system ATP-binding protein